nr:MAG TPA: hypothetical protein [Caudoviricetes sp.]
MKLIQGVCYVSIIFSFSWASSSLLLRHFPKEDMSEINSRSLLC